MNAAATTERILKDGQRILDLPPSGAPYDYEYPNDFLKTFSRSADLRQFKKFAAKSQAAPGDHVMDVNLVFEPR